MLFVDVIRKKRDGGELSEDEIALFVDGLADGSLPAEQVSALAMAVFLNSMSFGEAAVLTRRMAESGLMIDWDDQGLDGPVVDKHSTGGIGDKVSFILAPIAAACGCYVPMISGRGLGHSGGTLDKIGSIPGYDPFPDAERFKRVVREVGCAIIGQTGDLAPADRRFYSIRDVTATVESVPLITASILSKKIAAGLEGLVMDVKFGSGAFMRSANEARELATSIIGTGAASGLKTHAILTDMNENHLLVADKDPGILTVPIPGKRSRNLQELLDRYLEPQKRSALPVHRIDPVQQRNRQVVGALLRRRSPVRVVHRHPVRGLVVARARTAAAQHGAEVVVPYVLGGDERPFALGHLADLLVEAHACQQRFDPLADLGCAKRLHHAVRHSSEG